MNPWHPPRPFPPAAGPRRAVRVTLEIERATAAGALGLGLPVSVVGGILLVRHYRTLPADGFKGFAFAVDLLAIVGSAALIGALLGMAIGVAVSPVSELRRPGAGVAMVAGALVATALLALPGYVVGLFLGPIAGAVGIAVPALGVRWGLRAGRASALGDSEVS